MIICVAARDASGDGIVLCGKERPKHNKYLSLFAMAWQRLRIKLVSGMMVRLVGLPQEWKIIPHVSNAILLYFTW